MVALRRGDVVFYCGGRYIISENDVMAAAVVIDELGPVEYEFLENVITSFMISSVFLLFLGYIFLCYIISSVSKVWPWAASKEDQISKWKSVIVKSGFIVRWAVDVATYFNYYTC